jgi:hypothetical protein
MTIGTDDKTTNNYLTFYINQKKIIEKNVEPHWTLVYYLRTSKYSADVQTVSSTVERVI